MLTRHDLTSFNVTAAVKSAPFFTIPAAAASVRELQVHFMKELRNDWIFVYRLIAKESVVYTGRMYTRNLAAEDDPSLAERTFRVVDKASGKCCGIASSIGRGQVVTALHVVEGYGGVPIPVQAKGLDLTLVAKNEALDVAILQPAGMPCTHSENKSPQL